MSLAATSTLPVLYSFHRSSCSWRVRIGLNLKKIAYETRPVNLLTEENVSSTDHLVLCPGQSRETNVPSLSSKIEEYSNFSRFTYSLQKTAEYKKIQPFGAVPAFIDSNTDGQVLIESLAILDYLEETRPNGRAIVDPAKPAMQ